MEASDREQGRGDAVTSYQVAHSCLDENSRERILIRDDGGGGGRSEGGGSVAHKR